MRTCVTADVSGRLDDVLSLGRRGAVVAAGSGCERCRRGRRGGCRCGRGPARCRRRANGREGGRGHGGCSWPWWRRRNGTRGGRCGGNGERDRRRGGRRSVGWVRTGVWRNDGHRSYICIIWVSWRMKRFVRVRGRSSLRPVVGWHSGEARRRVYRAIAAFTFARRSDPVPLDLMWTCDPCPRAELVCGRD